MKDSGESEKGNEMEEGRKECKFCKGEGRVQLATSAARYKVLCGFCGGRGTVPDPPVELKGILGEDGILAHIARTEAAREAGVQDEAQWDNWVDEQWDKDNPPSRYRLRWRTYWQGSPWTGRNAVTRYFQRIAFERQGVVMLIVIGAFVGLFIYKVVEWISR